MAPAHTHPGHHVIQVRRQQQWGSPGCGSSTYPSRASCYPGTLAVAVGEPRLWLQHIPIMLTRYAGRSRHRTMLAVAGTLPCCPGMLAVACTIPADQGGLSWTACWSPYMPAGLLTLPAGLLDCLLASWTACLPVGCRLKRDHMSHIASLPTEPQASLPP